MADAALLWPDDKELPTSRDGILALMGGRHKYFISRNLAFEAPILLKEHRATITRHILENAGAGVVELMTHNIEPIVARRPYPVQEKLERLLRALAQLAKHQVTRFALGAATQDDPSYDLMRAAGLNDHAELMNLLRYAHSQGFVDYQLHSSGSNVGMTIPGLMHVQARDEQAADSRSGFVAMWFNPEMTDAFSGGMVPAIEANGYEAVRIDSREYNNKIDDEIISEIRRARFVVADFSCGPDGARGGVYFEAGFALALDKPVIFTVREADLPRVHFDTRQFNHIVWKDPAELEERLRNRIGATIGRPAE